MDGLVRALHQLTVALRDAREPFPTALGSSSIRAPPWAHSWNPQPPLILALAAATTHSTAFSNFCSLLTAHWGGISALTDSNPAITKCSHSVILRMKEAFLAFLLGRNKFKQLVIFLFFFPSKLNLLVRIQVSWGKSTVSAGGAPAAAQGPHGFHQGRADSKPCTDRARVPHNLNFQHFEICLRPDWKKKTNLELGIQRNTKNGKQFICSCLFLSCANQGTATHIKHSLFFCLPLANRWRILIWLAEK